MNVRFRFVRPFRDAVGKSEIAMDVADAALPQAIAELVQKYPALAEHLYENGRLSPYVNVFVNSQPIDIARAETTTIAENDEVFFLLPLTGGRRNASGGRMRNR